MIIKKQEAKKKIIGPMRIDEYKINSDFSGALVEINGEHGKIKSEREDRRYFIIKGEGKFVINDKEYDVSEDNLIFVPKNTFYDISGKMKYFLVCSPEFDSSGDVFL